MIFQRALIHKPNSSADGDPISPGSFSNKNELLNLIDFVILDLEKEKIISDKFYSDSKSRSFIKRGYSLRKIRNFLVQKGVKQNYIKESISKIISDNSDQDFFSAIKLCKKRLLPKRT